MRMTFVLVLGALRVAAVLAVIRVVMDVGNLFLMGIQAFSNASRDEYWSWFRGSGGVSQMLGILLFSIAALILSIYSFKLASWIVPGAVGQCSRCGHPSGSKPSSDGRVVCSECGATVVK